MIRAVHLVAIALAWAGLAYKLRDLRRAPGNRALRALCLLLLVFSAAVTIGLPPLYQRIPLITEHPSSIRLAQHVLAVLAAFWLRVLFDHLARPGARTTYRFWAPYGAATLLAMVVLFALAPVGADADDFVNQYAAAPYVAEYLLVFLTFVTASLAQVFRLSLLHAKYTPHRFLRIGLRLIAAGSLCCVAFAVHKAGFALVRRLGGVPSWPEGPVSTTLVGCTALLFVVGATIAGWAPRLTAWRRRVRRDRAYRRLYPLWSAIHEALPNVTLVPTGGRQPWQSVEFRLYRRIIEIRDGILALRPYVDDRVTALARERAAAAGLDGEEAAAVAEAATLASALRARADGHPKPGASALSAPPAADRGAGLDDEAAWFGRVSDALGTPVVTAVLAEHRGALPA